MSQPKVTKIIKKEGNENYIEVRNNLSQYKTTFQHVYSNVFPEIYCSTEKRGFDLKSTFHNIFKTYKDKKKKKKKKLQKLGENPQNYESVHNETSVYKQKPIKIDDFNEAEEKENKEHVEKRKIKRREVAEKNN